VQWLCKEYRHVLPITIRQQINQKSYQNASIYCTYNSVFLHEWRWSPLFILLQHTGHILVTAGKMNFTLLEKGERVASPYRYFMLLPSNHRDVMLLREPPPPPLDASCPHRSQHQHPKRNKTEASLRKTAEQQTVYNGKKYHSAVWMWSRHRHMTITSIKSSSRTTHIHRLNLRVYLSNYQRKYLNNSEKVLKVTRGVMDKELLITWHINI